MIFTSDAKKCCFTAKANQVQQLKHLNGQFTLSQMSVKQKKSSCPAYYSFLAPEHYLNSWSPKGGLRREELKEVANLLQGLCLIIWIKVTAGLLWLLPGLAPPVRPQKRKKIKWMLGAAYVSPDLCKWPSEKPQLFIWRWGGKWFCRSHSTLRGVLKED